MIPVIRSLPPKGPLPDFADASIISRFEAQVQARPHAIALVFEGEHLSYGQLHARVIELATHLRERGVGRDSLVGIHLDRSFDLIAGILAILKAGGAYLPLDLACPEDRLNFFVKDAGAQVILTESRLANRFKHDAERIICVDRETPSFETHPRKNLWPTIGAHDLAYTIYTSGSTGTPKGVCVTQQNVTRLFSTTDELFHFTPQDVWTLFHSSAFDFSVWEIFGALLYGGRLVIVPYMVSRSATAFRKLLISEHVTVLNQTPSAFRQLIQADQAAAPMEMDLRYVIFGGEALEPQSLRPWFERYGDAHPKCVNMYGITETTVHVTHHVMTKADLEKGGSNIGLPLPDLRVYLVDEAGELVPRGEMGEMLVGGLGVARGYLNRPELTHERFVANTFEPHAPSLLYRSGDLARERENGELEYLGRSDHQVKIRGFRIELQEIESALVRHPAVRECAVISRADDGMEPRLVAYIVAVPGATSTVEDLRAHLIHSLPDYMIPAGFVFLPAFPITLNGKLDRAALPAPGSERPQLAASFTLPGSDLELMLARLWKAALRHDVVGTDDNFFDLGGDSLLLTTLHRQLQGELKREIPITDLFQFPTIRRLAEHLGRKTGNGELEDKTQARAQLQRAVLARSRRPGANQPVSS